MSIEKVEYKGQLLGIDELGNVSIIRQDSLTKSLKVISTNEFAVHNKQGFSISGIYGSVANSGNVNYAFKTPAVTSGKVIHLNHSGCVTCSW